jgi:molybdopterin converting factor small subunit
MSDPQKAAQVVKIQVKGYLTFKLLIGDQTLEFPDTCPPSLRQIIALLIENCGPELQKNLIDPSTGSFSRQAAVLVNGRHHTHIAEGMDVLLKDGDQVAVFPPLAGGAW